MVHFFDETERKNERFTQIVEKRREKRRKTNAAETAYMI